MATATAPISYESPLNMLIQLLGNKNVFTDTNTQQQTQQLLQQLLSTNTNSAGTTSNTGSTTNTADLDALRTVFANTSGGMSADQLKNVISSIFTEGGKEVPSLIGAYANATGSRATGNSGTRLALDELNKSLSTQAATALLNYNTNAQQTAGNVAGQIANATKQTDTVQNQVQQQQQQQVQNTNQTQTGTQNSQQTANQNNQIKPNYGNLGIAAGGSLLNNLLKGVDVKKLLGMGGGADTSGITMGAGGSPLSFGGLGSPGGITSLSSPSPASFAMSSPASAGIASGPTGLNNNFTGLRAAPTQDQLVQSYLPAAQASFGGGLGGGLSGVGGASTLDNAGTGISGAGAPMQIGSYDGSGLMGLGTGLSYGGIGGGNVDFFGGGLGTGFGALGGEASTIAGSASPWGISTADNGGITDWATSNYGAPSFSDYLANGAGAVGSMFGGIGDAIGGAASGLADWIGGFFADGGQVRSYGGSRPMGPRGYADGGGIGAPGDMRYRGAPAPAPVYGNNLFDTVQQQRMLQAGLGGREVMQVGNTPQASGQLPAPNAQQVMQLLPFLLQQMVRPGGMGYADGGMVGPPAVGGFGMADGGRTTPNRNQNYLGVDTPREQSGAINYTGYDNPGLAQFVNQGGSAANYIDPAVQAAELAARAQAEAQAQQQAQMMAQQMAGQAGGQAMAGQGVGATNNGVGALQVDRQGMINQNLQGLSGQTPQAQMQALQALSASSAGDPEVARYYSYLAQQIGNKIMMDVQAQQAALQIGGGSGVGSGTASGVTAGDATAPGQGGIGSGVSAGIGAVGSAVGAPPGIASGINAIGNAVGDANATANAAGLDAAVAAAMDGLSGQAVADAGAAASAATGVGAGNSGAAAGVASGDGGPTGGGAEGSGGASGTTGDGGGGGGGGGKIICTAMNEMYGLPPVRNRLWVRYSQVHMRPEHQRGYHRVFLPLVRYGFKQGDGWSHVAVRRVLEWIAVNRTAELELKLANAPRKLWRRALLWTGETAMFLIGKVTK